MVHRVHLGTPMRSAGYLVLGCLAACGADGTASVDDVTPYEETAPAYWCSTVEPPVLQKMEIETTVQRTQAQFPRAAKGAVIEVHVHVINTGPRIADGNVTDEQIARQVAVLNAAYESTGFAFHLATIDRTTSPTWFAMQDGTAAEHAAKAALRKGTARELDLYTAGLGASSLGWASFPSQVRADPIGDGVVMLYRALPGVADGPYALGDQTVHEVGHWLGLFHTYQPECRTANGDFVDDTPATDAPAFGCPIGRDTCGGGGDDAVRNYMDSTDDACMNAFTPGQAARIRAQFDTFRAR